MVHFIRVILREVWEKSLKWELNSAFWSYFEGDLGKKFEA